MAMPQIKGDCLIGQGEVCKRAMQMSLTVGRNIIIWLQNACLSGVKLVNVFSVHFRTQVNYSSSYRKRLVVSVTVSICALCLSKRNWKSIVCYYLKFYFQCFPLPFSKWVLARLPDYWSWISFSCVSYSSCPWNGFAHCSTVTSLCFPLLSFTFHVPATGW